MLILNKENGLSDIRISIARYVEASGVIVVGYENGNVDIVAPERTFNIPGIKNNQNILTSKRINDIASDGDNVFLATDFGIVEIDASIREFKSTLFTNEAITHVAWNEGEQILYGTSVNEVYELPRSADPNLADIHQWNIFPPGTSGNIQDLAIWQEKLYIVANDQLWLKENATSFTEVHVSNSKVRSVRSAGSHLLVTNEYSNIITWDGVWAVQHIDICLVTARDVLMINPETFWYLKKEEFGQYDNTGCRPVELPGVPSIFISEMKVMNSDLYVASGGVTRIYNNLFREDGFYTNASGNWESYNIHTVSELADRNMRDIYAVEKDPVNNQVYFGTFWDGVIQFSNGEIKIFDETNSTLQFSVTNPDRIRVADLFMDQKNNLWVANHDAIRPLSVMTPEGKWNDFGISVNPRIENLVVDEYQNIWMDIYELGLYIFQPNDWGTDSDDVSRVIIPQPGDGSGTGFDNARINKIAIDRNGGVWLGTESGPVLFDCGNFAMEDLCQGRKPVIEINGQLGVLLRNENIKTIAIDGGNRKWFGTENGVYVVSSSLDRIDHHFHTDNSPLPHNTVSDITIDEKSGEVYIATDDGLVSYRGEAVDAQRGESSQITVFPNPVPPQFNGSVGIRDVGENALVRITTLSGRLIYENRAIGGQLAWNRLDQDGSPVASGIYLVYATTDQSLAPYTQVGKVFILH